ncbi:MAG: hypothetical protein PHG96_07410, partial [Kiritimatiellae bacterium]|nr:hypothetical protein [Kiritimatiellia bacterium]
MNKRISAAAVFFVLSLRAEIFSVANLSDREIRDDRPDVAWRVNHNLLIGLRADVEIYRCRGLIDETP